MKTTLKLQGSADPKLALCRKVLGLCTDAVIYYPGSFVDFNVDIAFKEHRIIHVDMSEEAVKLLRDAGCEAYHGDAEDYIPSVEIDAVFQFNTSIKAPLALLKRGGYAVTNRSWNGRKLRVGKTLYGEIRIED